MSGPLPTDPDDAQLGQLLARRAGRSLDEATREHLVGAVLQAAPAGQHRSGLSWGRLLLPLAAVVIVASVAAVTWWPRSVGPLSSSAPSASGGPETTRVLSADELRNFAAVTRSTAVDVVASVGVDGSAPSAAGRIGVIHELGDMPVFGSASEQYPALTYLDLSAPVALRLEPDRGIQFLGHVSLDAASGLVDTVPGVVAAITSTPAGSVRAAQGWLSTVSSPCGPAPQPGPPIGQPFNCGVADVLSPTDQEPEHVTGVQSDATALRVQKGAYSQFAPGDRSAGGTPPEFGTYLVQHVENRNSNCVACDGWLMVGRLAPAPVAPNVSASTPTPLPASSPTAIEPVVRTAGEMSNLLHDNGNAWIGHVMLVQGNIVPMGGSPCTAAPGDCPIGAIDGSDELLYPVAGATPSSVPDGGLSGTFAVRVRESGLDLLGPVVPDGSESDWPPSASAVAADEADPPGSIIVVRGWLGWSGPVPCPAPLPPTPPPDSPFDQCPAGWLGSAASTPMSGIFHAPADAIRVNWTAINQFGDGAETVSGTFVLRLLEDPRPSASPKRGWQVIARIDADPASPSASPSASLTDPAILTIDQLRAAVAGHRGARLQPLDVIVDASVDLLPGERGGACPDNFESCDRIGAIHGAPDLDTVLRRQDPEIQISQNVSAPIALRIADHGSLILLGHVNVNTAGGSVSWTVPEAVAAATAFTENELTTVDGWLAGGAMPSCGPAPIPASPPPVPPFDCAIHDYLTPTAEQVSFVNGNGGQVVAPPDGLALGMNEYNMYAPDPGTDQAPRHGMYLVKSVVNHSSWGTPGERGWLIVGRLQPPALATPPPAPSLAPMPPSSTPTPAASPLGVDDPTIQDPSGLAVETVVDVRGWLADSGPTRFCTLEPAPTTPPLSPWQPDCNRAWVSSAAWQPNSGAVIIGPLKAIAVQPSAYQDFAPGPASEPDNSSFDIPRLGTYTVELIRDPRFPDGALGWKVIARVDPPPN